jgi:hypothetical protein
VTTPTASLSNSSQQPSLQDAVAGPFESSQEADDDYLTELAADVASAGV